MPMKHLLLLFVPILVRGYKTHVAEQPDDIPDIPSQLHDTVQELALAFSLVLQNLTNASGIIRSGDQHLDRSQITYHPGNLQVDEEFVADKAAGFYEVLHDFFHGLGDVEEAHSMAALCPHAFIPNIMACIKASSCIIQMGIPNLIDMEIYAGMLEQMIRFEEIMWPLLRDALMTEPGGGTVADDLVFPEMFACDGTVHTAGNTVLLSVDSEHAETLAVAAALHEATVASHQILDSHVLNSSMDDTIDKLQRTWHGPCQKIGCDHTNYWDIFFRHHEHSLALINVGHPALLRSDIHMRFMLQHRVQRFIGDNHRDYSFVEKYARMDQEQAYSWDVAVAYHSRNKEALQSLASMLLSSVPESRLERLVDRHKLAWAEEELLRETSVTSTAVAHNISANQMSALEVDEGEGEAGDAQWGRRRRRRRRRRWFKAIVKAVVKVVKAVAKAIGSLLACVGDFGKFAATGYTRAFTPSTAGSIGLSAGNTNFLKDILGGSTPSGWISLDMGFSVGSTSEIWWAGAGFSGSLVCDTTGACSIYVAVAILATGNAKTPVSALCPLGASIGAMDCSHCAGASVTILCCSFDLTNGNNGCR
ncbi:unnamed protein product [Effrenium voratum]|nr:unnamed protein product [Effrenium voratum]